MPINPMKALFWSAVINGVVAVPLMVVIISIASNKLVMGKCMANRSMIVLDWVTVAVMGVAALCMLIPYKNIAGHFS
jgi:Mn2+/Fe2+ NRAMP family transporter